MTVCPRCKGNGSVPYPIDYEQGLFDETNCPLCGGSGEVETTNEEWLRSCTTEELAELIRKLVWCSTEIWQKFCTESEDEETDIKIVLEWLKEKHNA